MRYFGLGDSISSDDYPDIETGVNHSGACSIFGHYLRAARMVNTYKVLATDGATIRDIKYKQYSKIMKHKDEECIITLTAGGNDISFDLMNYMNRHHYLPSPTDFSRLMGDIVHSYVAFVNQIQREFPKATIILNTLYDPTDGEGVLPENCGAWAEIALLYSKGRRWLGKSIRHYSNYQASNILLSDVFGVFDGHGRKVLYSDGYYYKDFVIEPGFKGASLIAQKWVEVYELYLAAKHQREAIENGDRNQGSSGRTSIRAV